MKIDTSKKVSLQLLQETVVVFHPSTPDEARSLQERLFNLGFKWKNGSTEVQSTELMAEGALVLRNGQIGWNRERIYEGILRTLEDLPTLEEERGRPEPFNVNEDMTPREQFALMKKMAARILDLEVKVQELQKEVKGDEIEAVKLPLNRRQKSTGATLS
jgi:hypothetical protein